MRLKTKFQFNWHCAIKMPSSVKIVSAPDEREHTHTHRGKKLKNRLQTSRLLFNWSIMNFFWARPPRHHTISYRLQTDKHPLSSRLYRIAIDILCVCTFRVIHLTTLNSMTMFFNKTKRKRNMKKKSRDAKVILSEREYITGYWCARALIQRWEGENMWFLD